MSVSGGGGTMKTKRMAVADAWQRREKLEAIVENTLNKYGRVADGSLENKHGQRPEVGLGVLTSSLHHDIPRYNSMCSVFRLPSSLPVSLRLPMDNLC
jgi:hypothetical protein